MNGGAQSTASGKSRSGPSTRSDAKFRLAIHFRQVIFENRLGNIDGRENVGDQTDGQGDRKPANRSGAKQKQEERGHHGGDVRIDNGQKRFVETSLDGRRRRFAIAQFFSDALEDQNVGIHAHTDGQNDPGDTRQGQNGAERGKHGQ